MVLRRGCEGGGGGCGMLRPPHQANPCHSKAKHLLLTGMQTHSRCMNISHNKQDATRLPATGEHNCRHEMTIMADHRTPSGGGGGGGGEGGKVGNEIKLVGTQAPPRGGGGGVGA